MITMDDITNALMDQSDLGTKAIGRALVLLYSKGHGGTHLNPLGIAGAQYFLRNHTLTEKQVAFWRKPAKTGVPAILQHADELLQFAQAKEQRRFDKFNNQAPEFVGLLNERNDLLGITLDLIGSSPLDLMEEALLTLREFEKKHGMPHIPIESIPIEIDDKVMALIYHTS